MKTIEETKKWLLENRVDEYGDLELSELDFSDFNGNVFIDNMKVKGYLYQSGQVVQRSLYQSGQEVKESLFQNCQNVQKDLFQNEQDVKGDLFQSDQEVKGNFATQKLKEDEEYKISKYNITHIVKKRKRGERK